MRTRKRFGQHFLKPFWVKRLFETIQPRTNDTFMEIGAGRGALTLALAESGAQIIAVEIDRDLSSELNEITPHNVRIITGDFLTLDVPDILRPTFPNSTNLSCCVRIVGNLPYYISSPILFKLFELQQQNKWFTDATIMLQLEVAKRLVSTPGSRSYGPLAIATNLNADAKIILELPPRAFNPAPRVHSAVVHLIFRPSPVKINSPKLFQTMVRTIFSYRRKKLVNAIKPFAASRQLLAHEVIARANLDPSRRPETLQLIELVRLAEILVSSNPEPML